VHANVGARAVVEADHAAALGNRPTKMLRLRHSNPLGITAVLPPKPPPESAGALMRTLKMLMQPASARADGSQKVSSSSSRV
jgi:hypothetical protein